MIGTRISHYQIVERLGEGGMGEVYRAEDSMLDRSVALKMLRPELAHRDDILSRFKSEAMLLARLDHPHIARLHSMAEFDGGLCMVMEFVPGATLHATIERGGRLPWRDAAAVLEQLLDALEYAHRGGVIHRDIKPANLIIRPDGCVKVTDFGIARVLGSSRATRAGHIVGTLEYMAPEQIRGEDVDARADLYAAAIVFYELLTGRVPFTATTEYDLMRQQLEAPVPSVQPLAGTAPAWCDDLLQRALAKTAADRFASAAAFRDRLRELVAAEPPDSAPTSDLVKATRMVSAYVPPTRLAEAAGAPPATRLAGAGGAAETRVAAAPSAATATTGAASLLTSTQGRALIGAAAAVVVVAGVYLLRPHAAPAPDAPVTPSTSLVSVPSSSSTIADGARLPAPGPDAPGAPDAPAPVAPGAPGAPGAPTRPNAPARVAPDTPGAPGAPDAPGAPKPAAPRAPDAPPKSTTPAPEHPSTPGAPSRAVPTVSGPAIDFDDAALLVVKDGKSHEQDVLVRFDRRELVVLDKKTREPLRKIAYAAIDTATYSQSKQPRLKSAAATTFLTGILGSKLSFMTSTNHWLTLEGTGPALVLRLDKRNYDAVLPEVERRTGLTVGRETGSKK